MWQKARSHFSTRRVIYAVTTIVLPFSFVALEYKFGEHWLVIGLLFVIVSALTAFAIDHSFVPAAYRRLRKKHSDASKKAKDHPMLGRYYNDGIVRTEKELDNIISGRFNFLVHQVPEMSVLAMQLVDRRCILTFPLEQSEALLTPEFGSAHRYYLAMVTASKHMKESGFDGVIRVFILKKSQEFSARLLQFIEKNIADGIDVRLIFEDDLPTAPFVPDSLDFGYYETKNGQKWVMLLSETDSTDGTDLVDYIVDTNPMRTQAYLEYGEELIRQAKAFDEIMKHVIDPINGDLWPKYFAERRYEMHPPHGLSDEDADYIIGSALKQTSPASTSVLVLGFTPKLIRRLVAAKVADVVSIDRCESKPPEFKDAVVFETGNWLKPNLDKQFDAIVFDESLNNFSRIQLSLFFPQISRLLKPRGLLIGRVMGRFDPEQSGKYMNLSVGQAIELLRRTKGNSHDDFAPLIICLLHSRNFSFSQDLSLVDCDRWNRTLANLRDELYISDQEYRNWRLQFNFKLLSPDQDILFKESRAAGFSLFEARPVQGAYIDKCSDTVDFFRIYNFEYIGKH